MLYVLNTQKHVCLKLQCCLSMDDLPYLEDVEVTGLHVQSMAHQLQDSAVAGGCDASHWRYMLFVMVPQVLHCMILLLLYAIDFVIPSLHGKMFMHL